MKKLVLLLLSFYFHQGFSQEFSFQLYIEDAIGNIDSIVIGYDPNATQGLDTAFGEIDISSETWDTIIDVRALSLWATEVPQFKYSITEKLLEPFCFSSSDQFAILTEHWPVKISWDSIAFSNLCPTYIQLSNNEVALYGDVTCWTDDFTYTDLRSVSSVIFQTATPKNQMCFGVENIPDLAKVCFITFTQGMGLEDEETQQLTLFPNPATSTLTIELAAGSGHYAATICNAQGQLVYHSTFDIERSIFDISSFSNGIYFLTLDNGEQTLSKKFVKE